MQAGLFCAVFKMQENPCGNWLACDGITSVHQTYRVACIAGKPGSHMAACVDLNPMYDVATAS
jgi:hypothetical protein